MMATDTNHTSPSSTRLIIKRPTLICLPQELLLHIFRYLDRTSSLCFGLSCPELYTIHFELCGPHPIIHYVIMFDLGGEIRLFELYDKRVLLEVSDLIRVKDWKGFRNRTFCFGCSRFILGEVNEVSAVHMEPKADMYSIYAQGHSTGNRVITWKQFPSYDECSYCVGVYALALYLLHYLTRYMLFSFCDR